MPTPDPNALFNQLLEYQFRGVPFPATTFSCSLKQDMAVHKYADRDGAHIEPTGREPVQFKARIPFLNSIVPGPSESWGSLYPDGFKAFFKAMSDGSVGPMQHPELGTINVVPESCEVTWDNDKASTGVYVEASWIEATFDPDESANIFAAQSPISVSILSGLDLDAELLAINPAPPVAAVPGISFGDACRALGAIGDQVSLLQRRIGGTVDEISYHAGNLAKSLDSAVTTTDAQGKTSTLFTRGSLANFKAFGPAALFWPMRVSTTNIISSMHDLKSLLFTTKRTIGLYPVPMDATLAAISIDVKANVTDLITLNRGLLKSPIVLRGTNVRFYQS